MSNASTRLDLDRLHEIAKAATPGPWETYDPNEGSGHLPLWCVANDAFHNPPADEDAPWIAAEVHVGDREDAEHIATFDPPTVLALLAEVERLRDGIRSHRCDAHSGRLLSLIDQMTNVSDANWRLWALLDEDDR